MDGLQKHDDYNQPQRPRTPPKITPLPTLNGCLEKLQADLNKIQYERMQRSKKLEDVRREKHELAEREVEIQRLLREAGDNYAKLRSQIGGELAAETNGQMMLENGTPNAGRGLEDMGTTAISFDDRSSFTHQSIPRCELVTATSGPRNIGQIVFKARFRLLKGAQTPDKGVFGNIYCRLRERKTIMEILCGIPTMNNDFGYLVSAENHNAIIQATAYVPIGNCPRLIPPASACASHFPAEVAPFAIAIYRPDMYTGFLPFPPPTNPLPSPPLQAPPATPRNASHLYGEFSWPSLDISTLLEKLEDVVAEEEQHHQHTLSPSENDFAETLVARYGQESNSVLSQQAVFSEILSLLDGQGSAMGKDNKIFKWLEEVSEDGHGDDNESMYFTADDDASADDEYMDANSDVNANANDVDVDVDVDAIHDDEWVDDEDRRDMGELLGWFGGFGDEMQERLVLVNERRGRERRTGCVFA
ncbi:MAG: hypothetical protein L6R42_010316 [Xanthoria sp. 1 TBL-2021]|nr:MAG: hypothetical protein L6R42_010316 [Xanthoria sp. 1 TBL-2021]